MFINLLNDTFNLMSTVANLFYIYTNMYVIRLS